MGLYAVPAGSSVTLAGDKGTMGSGAVFIRPIIGAERLDNNSKSHQCSSTPAILGFKCLAKLVHPLAVSATSF